jgi:hypothetical protein
MNTPIRRKLDMASRVRDFSRTHPFENPGYTAAVQRLEESIARAEALAQQEETGRRARRASVVGKQQLRASIAEDLRLLVGLARSATEEQTEVAERFPLPFSNANHQLFLTRARVAVAQGIAQKELLGKYGLPDGHLERLAQELDRFEQLMNERHAATRAHVGARAELRAVTDEIMHLVQQLDAINRHRYRDDAEELAAWRSARDVAWAHRERDTALTPGTEVKPAA